MASITCRCGKVELKFPSTRPRVSTECCCHHCHRRVQYLQDLGGPKVPKDQPLLASKWDNRVEVLKGMNHLFAYKLTSSSLVVNIASDCCKTFLLGRHSGYDENCVTTSSDFPIFYNAQELQPSSRWFSNQWEQEHLAKFDPLVGIWVNEKDGSLMGEEGWEDVFRVHLESMKREIPSEARGLCFDEILDVIGRDKIVIVSQEGQISD